MELFLKMRKITA